MVMEKTGMQDAVSAKNLLLKYKSVKQAVAHYK